MTTDNNYNTTRLDLTLLKTVPDNTSVGLVVEQAWLPMVIWERVSVVIQSVQGLTVMERFVVECLLKLKECQTGELQEIAVIKADRSGRACRVALLGTTGSVLLRGTDFRMLLGTTRLRSTMFDVERIPAGFVFYGKGYGHGVGLSQQGACKMAQAGYSFQQILHFYYTGVDLKSYSPLASP